MSNLSDNLLKIGALVSGGLAVTGAIYAGYHWLRFAHAGSETGRGTGENLGNLGGATPSMRRAEMRELAYAGSPAFRMSLPWLDLISSLTTRLDLSFLRDYIRTPYSRAGYPGGLDDDEVVSLGILIGLGVSLFLAFTFFVFFGPLWIILGLFGIPLGFLVLITQLKSQAAEREIKILQAMPYLLDLLVLMLRSGTSLRIALSRVVEDYRTHPIGVELGQVLAEMDVGSSRAEAFRKLAARLKIQDLSALADAIVQSEELGWPLAETLERLGDRLSSERVLRAEAKAGAAGVLVMLPSTLVLAAAVLLLFSPIIVKLLRTGTLID